MSIARWRAFPLIFALAGLAPAAARARATELTPEGSAVLSAVLEAPSVKQALEGSRYRVFSVQTTLVKAAAGVQRHAHTLIYDYTRNVAHHVVSDVTDGVPGRVLEHNLPGSQPPPSVEEYAEAKALVMGLEQVGRLMRRPNVAVQEGFPVLERTHTACDTHRCVDMQVNEVVPGQMANFLLFVTVDLSERAVVEVRQPTSSSTMVR